MLLDRDLQGLLAILVTLYSLSLEVHLLGR